MNLLDAAVCATNSDLVKLHYALLEFQRHTGFPSLCTTMGPPQILQRVFADFIICKLVPKSIGYLFPHSHLIQVPDFYLLLSQGFHYTHVAKGQKRDATSSEVCQPLLFCRLRSHCFQAHSAPCLLFFLYFDVCMMD